MPVGPCYTGRCGSHAVPLQSVEQLFTGPGEIRALCRSIAWEQTSLGPVEQWPQGLRMAVQLCLDARFPMAVWAGPDLVLIYNQGYPPVLGRGRHPWALGRPAREVWSSIWDQIGTELEQVMRGESTWHEDRRFVIPRDGRNEETFFTYSFTPIQEADGQIVGVLNVFTETTERVKSLEAQVERYRRLFDTIDEGFCIIEMLFDDQGKPSDYRFLEMNPAFVAQTGLMDARGRTVREMVPEHEEHWFEVYGKIALTGEPVRFQQEARHLDPPRWYDVYAFRYGPAEKRQVAVLFNDVTGRKLAELEQAADLDALRRMHALSGREATGFESLLEEAMQTAIAIMHADQGNLQLLEGDTLRIVAHQGHQQPFLDYFAAAERVASVCGEATRQGERVVVTDVEQSPIFVGTPSLPVLRAAGVRAVQSTPMLTRAGRLVGILSTHWNTPHTPDEHALWRLDLLARQAADLIEAKQAEARLVAANRQLAEADRRKNEFLAVLSHELRNPLAPIASSLYVLDHAPPGGEQAERAKQVIVRQVGQLSSLVNDLLDVTRITRNKVQLHKERLELNEVVRRVVEDHRTSFERAGVHLELALSFRPVPVFADRTRIAQVVGNLLQNSAKFTVRGGRTRVSVEVEKSEAVVRVDDDGVGITRETLECLFQPFTQAEQSLDRSQGGLGLGLALIKGLVELHGGRVAAHSAGVGHGAEFVVRLPLDRDAVLEASTATARVAEAPRRVLIIEDNVDAADSLGEALQFGNHDVAVAYNGPEGLAKAREFHPDVVLCDIGLPGMDGYDVARAFRGDDALKGAFLVALSGYALPQDLQRAADAGFERHLAKPLTIQKLEEVLASVSPTPD